MSTKKVVCRNCGRSEKLFTCTLPCDVKSGDIASRVVVLYYSCGICGAQFASANSFPAGASVHSGAGYVTLVNESPCKKIDPGA